MFSHIHSFVKVLKVFGSSTFFILFSFLDNFVRDLLTFRRSRRQFQKFRKLFEVNGFRKSYFDIFTFNSDLDGLNNHYIPEKGRLLIWLWQRGNRELQWCWKCKMVHLWNEANRGRHRKFRFQRTFQTKRV